MTREEWMRLRGYYMAAKLAKMIQWSPSPKGKKLVKGHAMGYGSKIDKRRRVIPGCSMEKVIINERPAMR